MVAVVLASGCCAGSQAEVTPAPAPPVVTATETAPVAKTPTPPKPPTLPAPPSGNGHVKCCDGSYSPSCTSAHRGCCSRHGGVCG